MSDAIDALMLAHSGIKAMQSDQLPPGTMIMFSPDLMPRSYHDSGFSLDHMEGRWGERTRREIERDEVYDGIKARLPWLKMPPRWVDPIRAEKWNILATQRLAFALGNPRSITHISGV